MATGGILSQWKEKFTSEHTSFLLDTASFFQLDIFCRYANRTKKLFELRVWYCFRSPLKTILTFSTSRVSYRCTYSSSKTARWISACSCPRGKTYQRRMKCNIPLKMYPAMLVRIMELRNTCVAVIV